MTDKEKVEAITPPKHTEKTAKQAPVEALYDKLTKAIDEKDIIEYSEDGKTFKGYNAQVAINRLNDIVGPTNWRTESVMLREELVSGAWAVAMELTINIKIDDTVISKTGSGGAYARNISNAYKGARTSAFKNACKYIGIGKELYTGEFDDDIKLEDPNIETVNVKASDVAQSLVDRMNSAGNMEELKQLEPEVKSVKEKADQTIVFKIYNERKITLMSK